ncbi:MAG TPA: FAD-dependent oxidoreductase [Paracoccaceae bacterium]|nr:FAD-dependent oxidoreductase [Paracoccaceae bacterium]
MSVLRPDLCVPDLCVIGAGSGGLAVAAGAAQMGARTVLIEAGEMGGDCLNRGCVPSKALIAAATAADAHRTSASFGVAADEPAIDYAAVMDHVQSVIAAIAPHDSQQRFEGLGVTVIRERARFLDPRTVEVGGARIAARRFVIATGSSPAIPPIPGLEEAGYLTSDTLWENRDLPSHLAVIGAGPIGLEMAQAHRRLGARVTVLEAAGALAAEDPETAAIALARLRAEGIDLREGVRIASARRQESGPAVLLEGGETIAGSHLLVATGRRASVEGLGLDAAGVAHDKRGVTVDRGLRSVSNRRVYAIGDVAAVDGAGGLQFTHVAGHQAGLVIRSALFRLPVRYDPDVVPRVTYTDPELAQVGLTEPQARARHGRIEVARFPFAENDRARTGLATEGLVKAVIGRRGRILGASIVGAHAGELVHLWALALSKRLTIGDMAGYVAPYPTLGEASKRAAGAYFVPRLFESRAVARVVRLLSRLG